MKRLTPEEIEERRDRNYHQRPELARYILLQKDYNNRRPKEALGWLTPLEK